MRQECAPKRRNVPSHGEAISMVLFLTGLEEEK
jgi:hypothetical protein